MKPQGCTEALATGFHNFYTYDGARGKSPAKYARNAETLEEELKTATDPNDIARHTFYLAQSYRDARQPDKALPSFLKRAQMGGWVEEVGMSLIYAGGAMEQLGHPPELVLTTYLKAYEKLPHRAEPLYAAARVCRNIGSYHHGYLLSKAGIELAQPEGLFVDASVYDWRMLDEFQMAAFRSGHYADAVEASDRLLTEAKYPPSEQQRLEENAAFALARYDELVADEAIGA